VGRLHRRLRRLEELSAYTYSLTYYMYYRAGGEKEEKDEEDAVVVGNDIVLGVDKVKESCVLEIISRRGCMDMEEVAALCNTSKFFIRKLARERKVVRLDRDGRVCPRE